MCVQEVAVNLLTKIGVINPALVLPRLRRVLLETIGQLTNSGEGRSVLDIKRIIERLRNDSHVLSMA